MTNILMDFFSGVTDSISLFIFSFPSCEVSLCSSSDLLSNGPISEQEKSVIKTAKAVMRQKTLFLILFSRLLVEEIVSVVKNKIGTDHNEVQYVEEEHVPLLREACHIALIHKLGCYSRNVAEEDEAKEGKALSLCGSRLPGFHYVEGPGCAKADDHCDFKNFCHGSVLRYVKIIL